MYKKSSAKYYQENKERLQKVLNDIEICLKKKNKKNRQYGRERYHNLSEDGKNKLVEYRKNKLVEYRKNTMEKIRFIINIIKYFSLENFASL